MAVLSLQDGARIFPVMDQSYGEEPAGQKMPLAIYG
jgi:hypothetical protein